MSKIKFTLNKKGVRDILMMPSVLALCEEHANATASVAGAGYEASSSAVGKSRVHARVTAVTEKAMQDTLDNNTLLKAVR